jgi:hypothetical protein
VHFVALQVELNSPPNWLYVWFVPDFIRKIIEINILEI